MNHARSLEWVGPQAQDVAKTLALLVDREDATGWAIDLAG